jgi:hypothetical protein
MKQELPAFESLLRPDGESSAPLKQVMTLYHSLCRLSTAALGAFADEVSSDSVNPKHLPPSCTVHVVTSNTIR